MSAYSSEDLDAVKQLTVLKQLSKSDVETVISTLKAVERLKVEAMKDEFLAKEIVDACYLLAGKAPDVRVEEAIEVIASNILDVHRLTDLYLENRERIFLGSNVNYIDQLWNKIRRGNAAE